MSKSEHAADHISGQNETTTELELLSEDRSAVLEKAMIDTQIATAKQYPRSLDRFKKSAISMALIDEETAASCIYRRPVGKDPETGKQKYAEGMSIRMAEIVGASYGNLRVAATLIEQTPRQVRARGMAIDLESNFASTSEVVEATIKKNGQPIDERMRVVIAKAALAKARRDATFQVVPRALAKPIETEVRRLLLGDSKSIADRRAKVMAWINVLGIDVKRVWAALGIGGEADLGVEQLEELTGIRTAIKDGEVTIDEAFPDPAKENSPSGAAPKGMFAGAEGAATQSTSEEKSDNDKKSTAQKPPESQQQAAPTENTPAAATSEQKKSDSPQTQIEKLLERDEIPNSVFLAWAKEHGFAPKSAGGLSDVPDVEAIKMVEKWSATSQLLKARMNPPAKGGRKG